LVDHEPAFCGYAVPIPTRYCCRVANGYRISRPTFANPIAVALISYCQLHLLIRRRLATAGIGIPDSKPKNIMVAKRVFTRRVPIEDF
jgi:hypothetical protein